MDIFILILAGAIVFTLKFIFSIDKPHPTTKANKPRGYVGEAFPTIVVYEEPGEPVMKVEPVVTRAQAARRQPQPVSKRETMSKRDVKPVEAPVVEEKSENQYALKDKSDIKKAIIYSEIFNRKYN
ncbi:MAG: hypothetical protein J6B18_06260 [Bacteroidaceae bacterium]|nr:hypothetical protein [Bacteroidaceae bacterium]